MADIISKHGLLDTRGRSSDHGWVRTNLRVGLVVVALTLVTWQGALLSIPHHHADSAVPQEELGCSVSRPLSHENHLHGAGTELTPQPCIACLFGHTEAAETALASGVTGAPSIPRAPVTRWDWRTQIHSYLPLLRGPPCGV